MELLASVFKSEAKCTNCLEIIKKLKSKRECSVCLMPYCENCSVKVKKFFRKDKIFCQLCLEKLENPSVARLPTEHEYETKLQNTLEIQKFNPLSTYQLLNLLGDSTTGEVFEGLHIKMTKSFALKSVHTETIEEKKRILNEIYMMKSTEHPNILEIKEVYLHISVFWIVTDLMEFDLEKILPLPPDEAILAFILNEIAKGLSWLHRYSKIHCELIPSNILVSKKGFICLSGFGKSSELTVERPEIEIENSFDIVDPPEEILSVKSDIWRLGILAVELAENEGLFSTYSEDELPEIDKKWSPAFVDFCEICLREDPNLRPNSYTVLEHPFFRKSCSRSDFIQACLSSKN